MQYLICFSFSFLWGTHYPNLFWVKGSWQIVPDIHLKSLPVFASCLILFFSQNWEVKLILSTSDLHVIFLFSLSFFHLPTHKLFESSYLLLWVLFAPSPFVVVSKVVATLGCTEWSDAFHKHDVLLYMCWLYVRTLIVICSPGQTLHLTILKHKYKPLYVSDSGTTSQMSLKIQTYFIWSAFL